MLKRKNTKPTTTTKAKKPAAKKALVDKLLSAEDLKNASGGSYRGTRCGCVIPPK